MIVVTIEAPLVIMIMVTIEARLVIMIGIEVTSQARTEVLLVAMTVDMIGVTIATMTVKEDIGHRLETMTEAHRVIRLTTGSPCRSRTES